MPTPIVAWVNHKRKQLIMSRDDTPPDQALVATLGHQSIHQPIRKLLGKFKWQTLLILDGLLHVVALIIFADNTDFIVFCIVGEVGAVCGLLYDRWRKATSGTPSVAPLTHPVPE